MGSYEEKMFPDEDEAVRVNLNESAIDAHFLLRGGRPSYENKTFSEPQIEALTALCDTVIPSLDRQNNNSLEDELKLFYGTSASQAGIPQYLAGYISERLEHPALVLLRLSLWLLSTWYGTFILCGRLSLSWHFPYFQRFSQVLHNRREEIMLSWLHSPCYLFRLLFKGVKFLCCISFYTKVDEKNENPSWKAMGYCGPDPELSERREKEAPPCKGPLHEKVIDLHNNNNHNITDILGKAGCEVVQGASNLERLWKRKGKKQKQTITVKCDVVVVGSGSGGGVVAGVLAKAGHKVIVVEKGKYFARNGLSLLEGPSLDQMYEGAGLLATDDLGILLLAGSTVGGGSCVNWSASLRTPPHVLAEWTHDLKLTQFSSARYTQAMDAVCTRMGVQEAVCSEGFMNKILRKGCAQLNYNVNNVPCNGDPEHYCGWCSFGCKDGKKQGTQETWLVDAVNQNAQILTGCRAVAVIHDKNSGSRRKKKAIGVAIQRGNTAEHIFIESKVTVVSCGALCNPCLLKQSGLRNPNIGRNLHLHPVQMAWGDFPEEEAAAIEGKSYEGRITSAMCTVADPSGYGYVIQTPSLHPGMFSALMPWMSALDMKERMSRFSRTAHIFVLARDKGSGTAQFPGHVTYSLSSHDEKNLHNGIEKVLRILVAAGAEEIGTHHCNGERLEVKGSSPEEVESFIKCASSRCLKDLSTPLCSAHQMGSCRMGVDERSSVVDGRGETWEVEGLFVADASVLPTALGVNPMVTVQSIAYCIANSVLESLCKAT